MRYMVSFAYGCEEAGRTAAEGWSGVGEMTRRGVVEAIYLAAEARRGWIVVRADSEAAARLALEALPVSGPHGVEVVRL